MADVSKLLSIEGEYCKMIIPKKHLHMARGSMNLHKTRHSGMSTTFFNDATIVRHQIDKSSKNSLQSSTGRTRK